MTRRFTGRLLAAAAAACALAAAAPAAPAPAAPLSPDQLTLRLPDLPGYENMFEDCAPVRLRGDDAVELGLRDVGRNPHRGCYMTYERLWTAPGRQRGPVLVGSGAFVFDDVESAQAALAEAPGITALVTGDVRSSFKAVEPTPAIGDEAVLLRDTAANGYVVWRSGTVLALVRTAFSYGRGDELQAAREAATAQQARIVAPTASQPSDFDDLEVWLDDPRLDVPVWWAERTLDGGARLPRARLQMVERLNEDGLRLALTYGPREDVTAFVLTVAHPRAFAEPPVRRELRRIRRDRCTRVERIGLPGGSATVYTPEHGCRGGELDGPAALVRLPRVRIGISPEYGCAECTDVVTPWASEAGVRAVVRALRPRTPLAEAPAPPPAS